MLCRFIFENLRICIKIQGAIVELLEIVQLSYTVGAKTLGPAENQVSVLTWK